MRITFCGSGEVALPTLEALCRQGHQVTGVITQPPRPAGRGSHLTPTPVDGWAGKLGLSVTRTANINAPETLQIVQALRPEVIVVVDFGQKVGQPVRQMAELGAVNLHTSLLPELRGAAPVNWAIIRGHVTTGVTTFMLVDRMDAGPILLHEAATIEPEETAEELRARLARIGAGVVLRTLEGLRSGQLRPCQQDESHVTLAPKLKKSDGRIDFADTARNVVNRVCGTWPWPGAAADFHHAGRSPVRVILARAGVAPGQPAGDPAGPPGTVAQDLTVQTGAGRVAIRELKVAGKRLIRWADFVNGYHARPGDRFETAATSEGG